MTDLVDQLFTPDDIRAALRAWHQPNHLAQMRLAQSQLLRQRLPPQPPTALIVAETRELLLQAMHQLAVAPYTTNATQLEQRLIYGKFILKKTGNAMTREVAMSAATLNRRLAQEIAELAVLLSRMAATTLDRGRSSPINTIAKVVSADIPTREDFVGRTDALAQARSILTAAQTAPVLAIWGLGGVGKTTLAAALTADAQIGQHFSDGVLWVSLGPDRNPQAALMQIMHDLGLDDDVGEPKQTPDIQRRMIRTALASRRILIVLDDVWHAEDAQALMLGSKGAGYVITTRQMALAHTLTGSVIHLEDFDPLETRALLQWHLPDALLRSAYIRVDLDDLAVRLSGLPLPVSVTVRKWAQLVRTQQMQRFADSVNSASQYSGSYEFADRLNASLQTLDPSERAALVALSLFPPKPNTFSTPFACAVADCQTGLINSLVDLGLLECQLDRYSMHPSVAEHVAGLMDQSDAGYRMADYCAKALADHDRSALSVRDLLNVCTALDQAHTQGQDDVYVAIVGNAGWLFERGGNITTLIEVLRNALTKSTTPNQHQAIEMQLVLAHWRSEPTEQRYTRLTELAAQASDTGDPNLTAMAARTMADISFEHDDAQAAVNYINSATQAWSLRTFELRYKERIEAAAMRGYMLKPHFEYLRNLLVRIIPKAIASKVDSSQVMVAMSAKGWLDFLAGDVTAGVALLQSTFAKALKGDHRLPTIFSAGALAWAHHNLGDYNNARTMAHHAIHSPHRDVFPEFVVQAHNALAAAALAQGNRDDAWAYLMDGLSYCEHHNADAMASELYVTMCDWHLLQGQLSEAKSSAEIAHDVACKLRFHTMLPATQTLLGTVASHQGDFGGANHHFNAVCKLFQQRPRPTPWIEAFFKLHYGRHLAKAGARDEAAMALDAALGLGRQLGSQEYVGLALFELAKLHIQHQNHRAGLTAGEQSTAALRSIGHAAADDVQAWLQDIR